jgi:hypothetical protein
MQKPTQDVIDRNYESFKAQLPSLLKTHAGKFAVLRHGKIDQFFDTLRDAAVYGLSVYGDGAFSVQEVTDRSADLGFFSHAVHHR